MEGVAQCQQEHLLVEPAQGVRRCGTECRGHRLVQAALVFADPVQQVAVAPEPRAGFLVELIVAQQGLGKEVLGHVQAPGKVRTRRLMALENLQQQAFESAGQFVAEPDEQGRWRRAVLVGLGVVAELLAEALQHPLPFE
ncbi:hypothetical protein FQZ97_1074750 [compost metagenome]